MSPQHSLKSTIPGKKFILSSALEFDDDTLPVNLETYKLRQRRLEPEVNIT